LIGWYPERITNITLTRLGCTAIFVPSVTRRFAALAKWKKRTRQGPVSIFTRNSPDKLAAQSINKFTLRELDSLSSFSGLHQRSSNLLNDNNPSYIMTFDDAVNIWLRHWRGEFQNRIAASYDVNPGRVNDVLKERKHVGSRKVAALRLSAA
jgi:hypothetical protein